MKFQILEWLKYFKFMMQIRYIQDTVSESHSFPQPSFSCSIASWILLLSKLYSFLCLYHKVPLSASTIDSAPSSMVHSVMLVRLPTSIDLENRRTSVVLTKCCESPTWSQGKQSCLESLPCPIYLTLWCHSLQVTMFSSRSCYPLMPCGFVLVLKL